MSLLSQSTISKKILLSGIGIHTGEKVNLQILPSALDGADAAILGASALVWKENS